MQNLILKNGSYTHIRLIKLKNFMFFVLKKEKL